MEKNQRHSKAEDFRKKIVLPGQRKAAIHELLAKDKFDLSDQLRLKLLFQKTSYLEGCEMPYYALIQHIKEKGSKELITKAERFFQKLESHSYGKAE